MKLVVFCFVLFCFVLTLWYYCEYIYNRIFDPDGTGTIPTSEMRTVMTTLGEKLTPEEVNAMLKEADPENSGKIDYASYVYTCRDDNTVYTTVKKSSCLDLLLCTFATYLFCIEFVTNMAEQTAAKSG